VGALGVEGKKGRRLQPQRSGLQSTTGEGDFVFCCAGEGRSRLSKAGMGEEKVSQARSHSPWGLQAPSVRFKDGPREILDSGRVLSHPFVLRKPLEEILSLLSFEAGIVLIPGSPRGRSPLGSLSPSGKGSEGAWASAPLRAPSEPSLRYCTRRHAERGNVRNLCRNSRESQEKKVGKFRKICSEIFRTVQGVLGSNVRKITLSDT
jgi:hypothetical protein